jgi:hypothetical protein
MKRTAALVLVLAWSLPLAHAARPARVDVDETPLFQSLSPDSDLVRKLPQGARLVVSNLPIQGFYKARTAEGEVGWVNVKAIELLEAPSPEEVKKWEKKRKEAKVEYEGRVDEGDDEIDSRSDRKPRLFDVRSEKSTARWLKRPNEKWMVTVFHGTTYLSMEDMRKQTGLDLPKIATQWAFELQYQHKKTWMPLLFRMEYVNWSNVVVDSSHRVYRLEASSAPLMGGVKFELNEEGPLFLDFAVLLGVSPKQSFTVTALSQADPNVLSMSAPAFSALIKFDARYELSEDWAIAAELGYRSLKSGKATYTEGDSSTGGASLLSEGGSLVTQNIDLSGLIASIGLSYRF